MVFSIQEDLAEITSLCSLLSSRAASECSQILFDQGFCRQKNQCGGEQISLKDMFAERRGMEI